MPTVLPPSGSGLLTTRSSATAPLATQNSQHKLLQRLASWRHTQLLNRALRQAGDPNLVLDLPCGKGQMWPLLTRHPNRVIVAADDSAEMLAQAQALQPRAIVERVRLLQTSAFAIDLPENAVECAFCMRLFHRLAMRKQRLAMLGELRRVTSDSIILSVWVDSHYPFWKPTKIERSLLIPQAAIESEFGQAGLRIVGQHDFLPGVATRRIYVLRKET